jgi:hypothetical protein
MVHEWLLSFLRESPICSCTDPRKSITHIQKFSLSQFNIIFPLKQEHFIFYPIRVSFSKSVFISPNASLKRLD